MQNLQQNINEEAASLADEKWMESKKGSLSVVDTLEKWMTKSIEVS